MKEYADFDGLFVRGKPRIIDILPVAMTLMGSNLKHKEDSNFFIIAQYVYVEILPQKWRLKSCCEQTYLPLLLFLQLILCHISFLYYE